MISVYARRTVQTSVTRLSDGSVMVGGSNIHESADLLEDGAMVDTLEKFDVKLLPQLERTFGCVLRCRAVTPT
ncbi:hypothetical protein R1flu_024217 [Riccia fluitans]|uniref:Uncharacterized protein n=1 Tax=Riccia fluitans TaxID=41844 RepID=A0ABD1XUA1_9MARC